MTNLHLRRALQDHPLLLRLLAVVLIAAACAALWQALARSVPPAAAHALGDIKSVATGECASGGGWCLMVTRAEGTQQIRLSSLGETCTFPSVNFYEFQEATLIGNHTGGREPEIATMYCEDTDVVFTGRRVQRTVLNIIDPEKGSSVAITKSPPRLGNALSDGTQYTIRTFAAFPKGPDGRAYPFIAPGYGEARDRDQSPTWGEICMFRMGGDGGGSCGKNFLRKSIDPGNVIDVGYFREAGGYVADATGDGWEDIHLLYHGATMILSGRNGQRITTIVRDVANGEEPKWFHSGRNNSINTAFMGDSGHARVAAVAGEPVGNFDDPLCNATRWAGMMQDRAWMWTNYYGFHPNEKYPNYTRSGDFLDNCLHYPSNGLTVVGGKDALIFNLFEEKAPVEQFRCRDEQDHYNETKNYEAKWEPCFNSVARSTVGTWNMVLLSGRYGTQLSGSGGTYVWGYSDKIHPSGKPLFLREETPDNVGFDISKRSAPAMVASFIGSDGKWDSLGALPVRGRPRLELVYPKGNIGQADTGGYRELLLRDKNGDGLMDILIDKAGGGTVWIGWDKVAKKFVDVVAAAEAQAVPEPTPAPSTSSCTFSIVPATVRTNQQFTFSWSSTGASKALIRNSAGTETPRELSGSYQNSISDPGTYTYTIVLDKSASKPNGTGSCSATVKVLPPSCTFSITPSTVKVGEKFTFTWASTGATSALIRNSAGTETPRALSGSYQNSISKAGTYTYTIVLDKSAKYPDGEGSCADSVKVTSTTSMAQSAVASAWSALAEIIKSAARMPALIINSLPDIL